MKAVKTNVNLKKKINKTPLIKFRLFSSIRPLAFRGFFFYRGLLSIRVFFADGHYGLIVGTLSTDDEWDDDDE